MVKETIYPEFGVKVFSGFTLQNNFQGSIFIY